MQLQSGHHHGFRFQHIVLHLHEYRHLPSHRDRHERCTIPLHRTHHIHSPRLHHHRQHNIHHDQCGCIRNGRDYRIPGQRVHRNSYSNNQPKRWSNSHSQPHQYHWRLRHIYTNSHRCVRGQLHSHRDRNKRLSISHDSSHIRTSSRLPDIRQPNHCKHHPRR